MIVVRIEIAHAERFGNDWKVMTPNHASQILSDGDFLERWWPVSRALDVLHALDMRPRQTIVGVPEPEPEPLPGVPALPVRWRQSRPLCKKDIQPGTVTAELLKAVLRYREETKKWYLLTSELASYLRNTGKWPRIIPSHIAAIFRRAVSAGYMTAVKRPGVNAYVWGFTDLGEQVILDWLTTPQNDTVASTETPLQEPPKSNRHLKQSDLLSAMAHRTLAKHAIGRDYWFSTKEIKRFLGLAYDYLQLTDISARLVAARKQGLIESRKFGRTMKWRFTALALARFGKTV